MAINKKLVNQVNAAQGNPNVQAFLNMLSDSEGTMKYGYQQGFGRDNKIESLTDHPRQFHSFKQTDGKTNRTSAAGRYQFLSRTWDDMAGKLGLSDFGGESQDKAAIGLIAQAGALDDLVNGDINSALRKTGKIWASLPTAPDSYKQKRKGMDMVQRYFGEDLKTPTALALQKPAGGSNPSDVAGQPAARASNVAANTQQGPDFDINDFVSGRMAPVEDAPQDTANLPSWATDVASIMNGGEPDAPTMYDDLDLAAGSLGETLVSSPYAQDVIDAEADSARFEAMNQLFGDEQVNTASVALPTEIDRSIRKFIEEATA